MSNASILLGVNIDHVATLRQARYREYASVCGGIVEPDPLAVALLCEKAGADGITAHPREDGRHIQREDIRRLREGIATRLNMEMAPTDSMLAFALETQPEAVCLVPEKRQEVSTEGGLDVVGKRKRIRSVVKTLLGAGIEPSLFIDPELEQIEAAAEVGAPVVELHTGAYANARPGAESQAEYERLRAGAERAHELEVVVNAGHGINYVNVKRLRHLPWAREFNIGHSIVSRAVFFGIEEAVREMARLIREG